MKKQRAFTLVELLVSVSVIAILVSLLLTAVSQGKHKARSITCLNNVRQTYIDFKVALADDQGGQVWLNAGDGGFFQPTTPKLAICPEAPELTTEQPEYYGAVDKAYKYNDLRSSYSQNLHVLESTYMSKNSDLECNFDEISTTPLIMDGTFILVHPFPSSLPATDLYHGKRDSNDGGEGDMASINIPRHGSRPRTISRNWPESSPLPGAINVGFLDGHVSTIRLDNLWSLKWSNDYQPPANRPGLTPGSKGL
jgi:prepilin-type N-terminal cleavage/methylation domain-containing protein/prepilin-type processing-associated H-X9-DG protein